MDKAQRKALKKRAKAAIEAQSKRIRAELDRLNPYPMASDAYVRREIEIRLQERDARRAAEAARPTPAVHAPAAPAEPWVSYFVLSPALFEPPAAPSSPPLTDRDRLHAFGDYARADLVRWARRLTHFRIVRAAGGHASDADAIDAVIALTGEAALRGALDALAIVLTPHVAARGPLPRGAAAFVQPGSCAVGGDHCYVWIERGRMRVSLLGDVTPYQLADADVERAARIERRLVAAGVTFVDPPVANGRCICPQYYPDVWEDAE